MTDQGINAKSPAGTGDKADGECKTFLYNSLHKSPSLVNSIEPLLKAADVARVLQVSRTEAYRLMQCEIPTVRFGKQTVRVRLADLQAFIDASIQGGDTWKIPK